MVTCRPDIEASWNATQRMDGGFIKEAQKPFLDILVPAYHAH